MAKNSSLRLNHQALFSLFAFETDRSIVPQSGPGSVYRSVELMKRSG
jgi:hypothetical protein